MATKQYLFRVYHSLIDGYAPSGRPNYDTRSYNSSFAAELSYNDFLCSLPETLHSLSLQATCVAYADSCILIGASLVCVVVWELSDDRGADHLTPVTIFHPFLVPSTRGVMPYDLAHAVLPEPRTLSNEQFALGRFGLQNYHGVPDGFESYNLCQSRSDYPANYLLTGSFYVANIARDTERGSYNLQYIKRAVQLEDYFRSYKGTVTLNMNGSLATTRFPLWRGAMARMPYQHSGYAVSEDGRLVGRDIALSRRVLNGVTDMAQARRMFARRDWGLCQVMKAWMHTVNKLLMWFWCNQERGWPERGYFSPNQPNPPKLSFSYVPVAFMKYNLDLITDFVNLVGVATGNRNLLLGGIGWDAIRRLDEFNRMQDLLTDGNGRRWQYAVKGQTEQVTVLRHIIDGTAGLMKKIYDYEEEVLEFYRRPEPPQRAAALQWARDGANVHNRFSEQWPEMQADFLAIFGLLMTWQLTWDYHEATRAKTKAETWKSGGEVTRPKWFRETFPKPAPVVQSDPNLSIRFSSIKPLFAPFRIWTGIDTSDSYDEAKEHEEQEEREEAERKRIEKQQQDEEARKAKRKAEFQRGIEERRVEWKKEHTPNPNDPWDYRNFTSKEWWNVNMADTDMVEFTLRLLDVPDEIQVVKSLFRGASKAAPSKARKGIKQGDYNELLVPAEKRSGFIPWPAISRFIRRSATNYVRHHLKDDIKDAAKDYVENYIQDTIENELRKMDEAEAEYSDRQFWPADSEI